MSDIAKTNTIHLRIDNSLKQEIQAAAEAEHRTVSNYVTIAILEKLAKDRKNN